jgi:hypothetical protein
MCIIVFPNNKISKYRYFYSMYVCPRRLKKLTPWVTKYKKILSELAVGVAIVGYKGVMYNIQYLI